MLVARSPIAAAATIARDVAIAVKIANPSAAPSCCDVFSSAAARPALSAETPELAAVVTPDVGAVQRHAREQLRGHAGRDDHAQAQRQVRRSGLEREPAAAGCEGRGLHAPVTDAVPAM